MIRQWGWGVGSGSWWIFGVSYRPRRREFAINLGLYSLCIQFGSAGVK